MNVSRPVMRSLAVELDERSYPIDIGRGIIGSDDLLARHITGSQAAVITNEVVGPLFLDRVEAALAGCGARVDVFTLPDGESQKTLANYARVMDFLIDRRHNRTTTIIALGGGVVGDLAGFAAATYQRGVPFVQLPTTLLAQVDSSVGGKTAVNHPSGKNMIGAFYQPTAVLTDLDTLDTLPDRELKAGLAEIIKYGVIADADFFDWLEVNADALLARDTDALVHAIGRSCEIKAEIVAEDERETGRRALLNFGHTFGHALETLTGYAQLLHGEAVAIGMIMAADYCARSDLLDAADASRIRSLLAGVGLPAAPPDLDPDRVLDAMGMDKKVVDGTLRLILARRIGDAFVSDDVELPLLLETLSAGGGLCHG